MDFHAHIKNSYDEKIQTCKCVTINIAIQTNPWILFQRTDFIRQKQKTVLVSTSLILQLIAVCFLNLSDFVTHAGLKPAT